MCNIREGIGCRGDPGSHARGCEAPPALWVPEGDPGRGGQRAGPLLGSRGHRPPAGWLTGRFVLSCKLNSCML
eukprot:9156429-Pyramimonas_sp.AAC.1